MESESLRSTKTMTATKDGGPECSTRRTRLGVIRKKIKKLGKGYIDDSDSKAAASLDLTNSTKMNDHANTAQKFLHKYIQHGELPQEEEFPLIPEYEDWGDFSFPDLVEIRGKPTWQFMTAWHMPLRNQPHIKCMISTNIIAEDRLLYSEIVSILEVIRQRLRAPETRLHVDAPVFLYSFIDTSFRVLEGNLDGKKLIVRATKLYDLTDDDRKGYELSAHLTKWWYGDTTKRSTKKSTEKSTD